jgi:hypothetical protein
MALYTLCPNYVNHSCDDNDDFVNVLLTFCQTNGKKVALDKSDKIIEAYENDVLNKDNLKTWLDLLSRNTKNFEIIDIDLSSSSVNNQELTLSVCSNTYDKNLACNTKNDYITHQENIDNESINLIDKDELINSFRNNVTQVIQSTTGENSPIITGNENETN